MRSCPALAIHAIVGLSATVSCIETNPCALSECTSNESCDDGVFCNGAETCFQCACISGSAPCVGFCVEEEDACVECRIDQDCDDGLFCTGAEPCIEGVCQPADNPCPIGQVCSEELNQCSECFVDGDCSDFVECTVDTCEQEHCKHRPDDTLCPPVTPRCSTANLEYPPTNEQNARSGCYDPCVSQCELCVSTCLHRLFEEFAKFEEVRADLITQSLDFNCAGEYPVFGAGSCDEGIKFLFRQEELLIEVSYFEESSGAFLAIAAQTDCVDEPCLGRSYWPASTVCTNPVVSEVLCGQAASVGDPVYIP